MRFTTVTFMRSLVLFTSLHFTHASDEALALALQQKEYIRRAFGQALDDGDTRKRTHSDSISEEGDGENESENSEDTISREEILETLQDSSATITIGLLEDLLSLPYDPALDIPALKMMIKRCPELAHEKKRTALDLAFFYHLDEFPPAIVKVFLEAKINPYQEYDPGDGKITSFAKNIKESELPKQNKKAIFDLIKKYYPSKRPTSTKAPERTSRERAQADASALGHFDLSAFGKGGQRATVAPSQSSAAMVFVQPPHPLFPHFYVPLCPNLSPFKEKLRADCEKHLATSKEKLLFAEFTAVLEAFSEDTAFIEELLKAGLVNAREVDPESGRTHLDTLLTARKNDFVNLETLKALLTAGASPHHRGWGESFMERIKNPLTGIKNKWEIEMAVGEINDRFSHLSF